MEYNDLKWENFAQGAGGKYYIYKYEDKHLKDYYLCYGALKDGKPYLLTFCKESEYNNSDWSEERIMGEYASLDEAKTASANDNKKILADMYDRSCKLVTRLDFWKKDTKNAK